MSDQEQINAINLLKDQIPNNTPEQNETLNELTNVKLTGSGQGFVLIIKGTEVD